MKLLKKIKFSHIVLVILLYMGVNIGLKIREIYEASSGGANNKEEVITLLETYDFDGTPIEFYQSSIKGKYAMMNGIKIKFDIGYTNKDQSKYIYIEYYDKRIIKQNNKVIEPVLKLGNNKSKYINVYEFDSNSEVIGILENKEYDISITSSLSDSRQLDLDYEKLESMMDTWRLMSDDEKFVYKYKKYDILNIENNWQSYDFRFNSFYSNTTSFDLIDNDKIIIRVYYNFKEYHYELTQSQYDEFVSFITK